MQVHPHHSKKSYKNSAVRGFSLIEILIVTAISIIILSLTISTFSSISSLQSLDKDTEVVSSYIQKARNQTLNSKNDNQFGIQIASSTITLFEGVVYSPSAVSNVVYRISPKVSLTSNQVKRNGVVVNSFYFEPITGKPSATGTIQYRLGNSASTTRTITIYGSGLIETQ